MKLFLLSLIFSISLIASPENATKDMMNFMFLIASGIMGLMGFSLWDRRTYLAKHHMKLV